MSPASLQWSLEQEVNQWWWIERHNIGFFTFVGTSRGGRGLREEREGRAECQHAHSVETGRGMVCGHSVPQDHVLRSKMVEAVETRWLGVGRAEKCVVKLLGGGGQSYWLPSQLFTAMKSWDWVILIEWKKKLLTSDSRFLCYFVETWWGEAGRCWMWVSMEWQNRKDEQLCDLWII